MPASVWTGYLTFGLISMPVRLFSGARGEHVSFHMLHRKDLSRVKQQLWCPVDEEVIERPNDYIIDRERPRQHVGFGFGIHRCVGSRLAEMQLRVVWEEILRRHPVIEVMGEPKRVYSSFVRGYETLPVRIVG